MDNLKNIYIEETEELLNTMEQSLLSLENSPDDQALIDEIFRSMHTIKGSSSMFGFNKIADFVHNLETLYSDVRDGKIVVDKNIIEATFSSLDHIKKIMDDSDLNEEENVENNRVLTHQLLEFLGNEKIEVDTPQQEIEETKLKTYHIFFEPSVDVFKDGTNPLYLVEELHSLGKAKSYPHLSSPASLNDIDPTKCSTSWDILLTTEQGGNAIMDIFVFVENDSIIEINLLSYGDVLSIKEFTDSISYEGLSSPRFSFDLLKDIAEKINITPVSTTSISKQENKTLMEDSSELVKDIVKTINEKSKTVSSIRGKSVV